MLVKSHFNMIILPLLIIFSLSHSRDQTTQIVRKVDNVEVV